MPGRGALLLSAELRVHVSEGVKLRQQESTEQGGICEHCWRKVAVGGLGESLMEREASAR